MQIFNFRLTANILILLKINNLVTPKESFFTANFKFYFLMRFKNKNYYHTILVHRMPKKAQIKNIILLINNLKMIKNEEQKKYLKGDNLTRVLLSSVHFRSQVLFIHSTSTNIIFLLSFFVLNIPLFTNHCVLVQK